MTKSKQTHSDYPSSFWQNFVLFVCISEIKMKQIHSIRVLVFSLLKKNLFSHT
jgi:hypothetical protein